MYANITHSLDVWHKAKKLAKVLSEASQTVELLTSTNTMNSNYLITC
jgi:hypothetical protein